LSPPLISSKGFSPSSVETPVSALKLLMQLAPSAASFAPTNPKSLPSPYPTPAKAPPRKESISRSWVSSNPLPPLPPDVINVLGWLQKNVNVIWRHPPEFVKGMFIQGRRVIQVDDPHQGANFWHINTDLKILKGINHKNIEPLVTKFVAIKTSIDVACKGLGQFARSSTVMMLERIPMPILVVPSTGPNWPKQKSTIQ